MKLININHLNYIIHYLSTLRWTPFSKRSKTHGADSRPSRPSVGRKSWSKRRRKTKNWRPRGKKREGWRRSEKWRGSLKREKKERRSSNGNMMCYIRRRTRTGMRMPFRSLWTLCLWETLIASSGRMRGQMIAKRRRRIQRRRWRKARTFWQRWKRLRIIHRQEMPEEQMTLMSSRKLLHGYLSFNQQMQEISTGWMT